MKILVNMFNHNSLGQRSLEDVVGIFGHQLRALGHQVIWDTSNNKWLPKDVGLNVVVEGFTAGATKLIREGYQQGARFLMLATEEPTPRGFNWGVQEEMAMRQRTFPEAAKYFEGILHLVPGVHITKWFSQFAPSHYVELGYAPSLYRPSPKPPTYEFGFYGSLSERRLKILKKLAARMHNVPNAIRIVADFSTQEQRDQEMANCKIILQLRKFEKMGLVSSSRCNTGLHLGRPVICEPHQLSKPWDEVVKFTNSMEEFFATALCYRSCWQGLWQDQFDRFKAKFNPRICVGEPMAAIGFRGDHVPDQALAKQGQPLPASDDPFRWKLAA